MGYIFLTLAIAGEVLATTFLKVASGDHGFWWAWVIVSGGYIFAFIMLSLSLSHGIPLGIAYAIWAGVGITMVAIISWLAFGELLAWLQVLGIALVISGVILLEAGG
jgi:small multidrug resistance pump